MQPDNMSLEVASEQGRCCVNGEFVGSSLGRRLEMGGGSAPLGTAPVGGSAC